MHFGTVPVAGVSTRATAATHSYATKTTPSNSSGTRFIACPARTSALDRRASATALVQYGSVLRELAVNLRLRYNFSEGDDLWLVYDELVESTAPAHRRRTVLTKHTRTYR